MSDDSAQARFVSLKAQYDSKSVAWQERGEPVFRAWVDGGRCYLLPFFSFLGGSFDEVHQTVTLEFQLGTVVVIGPKAWDFCNGFSQHKATLLKPTAGHYVGCHAGSGRCQDRLRQMLQRFAHSLHPGAPEPLPRKFESRRSSLLPKIKLCRLDRIRRRLFRCLILGGFVAFAPSLALGV